MTEELRENKNTAKVVPRGSKEISNILGDRRSSYNVDGYDRVEEYALTIYLELLNSRNRQAFH